MAGRVLIATMGTSPGVVAEATLNLCKGAVEGLAAGKPSRVVMVSTNSPAVRSAMAVAHLLLACVLPEECVPVEVEARSIKCSDLDSRSCFQEYADEVGRAAKDALEAGAEVVVDITGGRTAMGAAAVVGLAKYAVLGHAVLTTTLLPDEVYRAVRGVEAKLRNYDLKAIISEWEQVLQTYGGGGAEARARACEVLGRFSGLLDALRSLVTGKARTVKLHP